MMLESKWGGCGLRLQLEIGKPADAHGSNGTSSSFFASLKC